MTPDLGILNGDCVELLATFGPDTIDAFVTDPPYGLAFMGKAWDKELPVARVWAEAFRVLKPGGYVVAFGGSRTYHRLTCSIEDAGFEIRDCLSWLYGSGFPKSLDASKAIDRKLGAKRVRDVVPDKRTKLHGDRPWLNDPDHRFESKTAITDEAKRWQGWGTALKPAWEPIILARKPLAGTVADNVLKHGTGAINVDGCRIGTAGGCKSEEPGFDAGTVNALGGHLNSQRSPAVEGLGRWPANVVLDEEAAELLDEQSGELTFGTAVGGLHRRSNKTANCYGEFKGERTEGDVCFGDTGGASRFFYTAKASKADRNGASDEANPHPTVKPLELMRWLCRLVTPHGGIVCDPFAGSGTTGHAALLEGFRVVLIERDPEMAAFARKRIRGPLFAAEEPQDPPVIDLMEALKASLAKRTP